MNSKPRVEHVPLTPAETNYFGPIFDRFQAAQKEMDAVLNLFAASHADELPGENWQLTKTGFMRVLPPEQPEGVSDVPPINANGQHVNGNGAARQSKRKATPEQAETLMQE